MKFTFLGTGTSQGIPVISCACGVCRSIDKKDNRTRTSLLIETEASTIVIDSGPDFRQQMLREKVQDLDAVVFTHGHKDHVAGLDDIRPFNYLKNKTISVFASIEVQTVLKREFAYIFAEEKYPGVPKIELNTIHKNDVFYIKNIPFMPIEVRHKNMEVFGFRINDFTYITDANYISEESLEQCKGSKILVLNALRHEKHYSHFSLSEAIAIAQKIGAEQTYFTHISHHLGLHDEVEKTLPNNMFLAYDGLSITI
jgi:phosphoribosyl 1,2-cyclic phosphate phosphodiesterase